MCERYMTYICLLYVLQRVTTFNCVFAEEFTMSSLSKPESLKHIFKSSYAHHTHINIHMHVLFCGMSDAVISKMQ